MLLKQLHTSILFHHNHQILLDYKNEDKERLVDSLKYSQTWGLNKIHKDKFDSEYEKDVKSSLHNIRKKFAILSDIFCCLRDNKYEDYNTVCILYISIVMFSLYNITSFFSGIPSSKSLIKQSPKIVLYIIKQIEHTLEVSKCEEGYEKIIEDYFETDKLNLLNKINTGKDKKLNSELYKNRTGQFSDQKNNKYDRD